MIAKFFFHINPCRAGLKHFRPERSIGSFVLLVVTSVVLMFFSLNTKADSNTIDSLRALQRPDQNDSIKMDLAKQVGEYFHKNRQGDSAIHYFKIMVAMAKKVDVTTVGAATKKLAEAYFSANNRDMALATIDSSILAYSSIHDTLGILNSVISKGKFHYKSGQHSEAIFMFQEILKSIDCSRFPSLHATLLNDLSIPYAALGDEEASIDYLMQSINIRERTDPQFLGVSYGNLANTYKRQENYSEAINQYKNSLSRMEGDEFLSNRIICLRNLGDTYTKIGKYILARKTLKQSFELAQRESNNQISTAMYHFLMSSVHNEEKDYDSVLVECQLVTDILGERIPPLLKAILLMKVSNSHLLLSITEGKPQLLTKAIEVGEEAMTLAKTTKSFKHINAIADLLMKVYGAVPNGEKTLEYAKLYGSSLDSLNKIERSKKVVAMQTKFETERKEFEIELLSKENELKDEKIRSSQRDAKKQKDLKMAIFLGFIISIILIALLFRQTNRRKKVNLELIEKNTTISKQDNEKALLLKEIHHRVKNNLQVVSSLLQLQSNNVSEDERAALEEGQSRVRAMALIHEKLYQTDNISEIDMYEYCQHLCRDITNVFGNEKTVKFEIDIENVLLDIDTAVPVGLMINELVTNAFKYAFQEKNGQMFISINLQEPGIYKMTLADTGPGLPPELNWRKSKGLGLRLINLLTLQLYGTVDYHKDELSTFTIIFKDTLERKKVA